MAIDTGAPHARSSDLLKRYSGSPNSPRHVSRDGRLLLLCSVVLFLISCCSYGYTVYYGFAGADVENIVENGRWRDARLLDIFLKPHRPHLSYEPLVDLTYRATYVLFGLEPSVLHAQNIFLHGCVSLALFFVLLYLFPAVTCLLASLLFAVMPIHVEAVTNISGRPFLLMSLLGLMSLYLSLMEVKSDEEPLSRMSLLTIFVLFLAALFSHQAAVSFLGLLLLSYLYLPEDERSSNHLGTIVMLLFSAFILFVAFRFIATGAIYPLPIRPIDAVDNPFSDLASPDRFLNGLILLGRSFLLALAPSALSADYSQGELQPLGGEISGLTLLHLLTAISLLILSIWGTQRRNVAGYCAAWFIIAALPTSNILFRVPIGFSETYVYLAGAGVGAMVAGGIELIRNRFIKQVTVGLYVSFLLLFTILHNRAWVNDSTLWVKQALVTPHGVKTMYHRGLGLEADYLREKEKKGDTKKGGDGKLSEMQATLGDILTISPKFADALLLKARLHELLKEEKEAEKAYVEAAESASSSLKPRWRLAEYYIARRRWEDAIVALERAYQIEPRSVETNVRFVKLAIAKGDLELGRRHLRILRELYGTNNEVLLVMQEYYTKFPAG